VKSGGYRELTPDEMNRVLTQVGMERDRSKAARKTSRPKPRQ
jgi:hypothetical protein